MSALLIIILHISKCRLICQRTNGSGFERMPFSEDDLCIPVRFCLIVSGKVQVDIRFLVSFKSKEGLKRNVKSGFYQFSPTVRTVFIRHVKPASTRKCADFFGIKVTVMTLTAIIVRTQRIYLCDSRHSRNKGGPYRTSGTYQITVIIGFPHQLLRNDIHHRISIGNDGCQFSLQSGLHRFGQIFSINLMRFVVTDIS